MENFKQFAKTVIDFGMPVLLIISDSSIKLSGNFFPTEFVVDEVERKIKFRARNEISDRDIFSCLRYNKIEETVPEKEFEIYLQNGSEATIAFND